MEQTESFGVFVKGGVTATAAPHKAIAGGKKRKTADTDADGDVDSTNSGADTKSKPKKAPTKKRGRKMKSEEADEEKVKEDDSADGGDGIGEFFDKKNFCAGSRVLTELQKRSDIVFEDLVREIPQVDAGALDQSYCTLQVYSYFVVCTHNADIALRGMRIGVENVNQHTITTWELGIL